MNSRALVPLVACLLVALSGCSNIPYYDESLDWFSRSDNEAEIDAIEERSEPPGSLERGAALTPAGDAAGTATASTGAKVAPAAAVTPSAAGPVAVATAPEAPSGAPAAAPATLASADPGPRTALQPRARIRQGRVSTVR